MRFRGSKYIGTKNTIVQRWVTMILEESQKYIKVKQLFIFS